MTASWWSEEVTVYRTDYVPPKSYAQGRKRFVLVTRVVWYLDGFAFHNFVKYILMVSPIFFCMKTTRI